MKISVLVLFLGLAFGIIFFSPLPYYQGEQLICKEGQVCPMPGWHTRKSLFQEIIYSYSNPSTVASTIISTVTPTPPILITPTILSSPVIGIQPSVCCPCPTVVDNSQIGKDGWVVYIDGKDYSGLLPKTCQNVVCQACEPIIK